MTNPNKKDKTHGSRIKPRQAGENPQTACAHPHRCRDRGGKVQQELPFVVGVLGEFSGDQEPTESLKDRDFASIDDTNFDEVMGKMAPTLKYRVEDTLRGEGKEIAVELRFNELEDFEPARVAAQVEPLRKLIETRNRLRDMAAQADRSEELENLLENMLTENEGDGGDSTKGKAAKNGGEA